MVAVYLGLTTCHLRLSGKHDAGAKFPNEGGRHFAHFPADQLWNKVKALETLQGPSKQWLRQEDPSDVLLSPEEVTLLLRGHL